MSMREISPTHSMDITSGELRIVSLNDIKQAQERLCGVIVHTPLLQWHAHETSVTQDSRRLYLKPENLQPIGAFKLRGAYNKIVSLSDQEARRGVIAYSSGNHAQGVAYAARALGVKAVIVMPRDAPALKLEATASMEAELVLVGPSSSERQAKAEELAAEHGYVIVPPYNDEKIIARVHELWKLGEPAPTAYRRVGNYSVMVFDAPDQQSANQLIDQIKYEQVVSWLGENPNILKRAQEDYVNTTLGVLVSVLKASGYALLACLGLGGLAGALLFTRRRAQTSEAAFSDAGGMLRLNLDELTPETNPARLLRDRN